MQRITLVAILAATLFSVACDGGSTTNVEDNDTTSATADVIIPPDQGKQDDVTPVGVDQPMGCELHPMFYKNIGKQVSCALETSRGDVATCPLSLYETDGKCAAKCAPLFNELLNDLQITDGGFCKQLSIGLMHCSFGNTVVFPPTQ